MTRRTSSGTSHGIPTPSLRYRRYTVALSQLDLAELAGVGRATVQRLEAGGTAHGLTIERLASALEVTPRALTRPLDDRARRFLMIQGGALPAGAPGEISTTS